MAQAHAGVQGRQGRAGDGPDSGDGRLHRAAPGRPAHHRRLGAGAHHARIDQPVPIRSIGGNIQETRKALEELERMREKAKGDRGATADIDATAANLRRELEFLKFQERQQALKLTGPEFKDARDFQAAKKAKLDFVPEKPKKDPKDKFAEDERVAKQIKEGEEQFNKDRAEALDLYAKSEIASAKYVADEKEKMMKQWFETIDRGKQKEIDDAKTVADHLAEDAKRAAAEARALGMTFSSAFEDAVVGGKDLRSVLQGLAQDTGRIVMRHGVTEPLAAGLEALFKPATAGLTGFISNLFKADGGAVMSGEPYIVGERGPELFLPGRSGTIIPHEALGRSDSAAMIGRTAGAPVNIDSTFVRRGSVVAPVNATTNNFTFNQTLRVGGNVTHADIPAIVNAAKTGAVLAVSELRRRGAPAFR